MAARLDIDKGYIALARFAMLPPQVKPAMRGINRMPHGAGVAGSGLPYDDCVAACRFKGGPLRSVCERLCADLYGS